MRRLAPYMSMPQYAKQPEKRAFRRIRSRSPRRSYDERQYSKRVKVWIRLPENRYCRGCAITSQGEESKVPATQCHHKYGRRGKLLLEEKHWIPLCDWCHDQVHRYPVWAQNNGLIALPGQWNNPPPTT